MFRYCRAGVTVQLMLVGQNVTLNGNDIPANLFSGRYIESDLKLPLPVTDTS